MGVYVKGMEMPKSCDDCYIANCPNDIGYTDRGKCSRHINCPIIEVPEPHGDLIDRGELHYIIGQLSLNWEYGQGISDCWDAFLDAPTIIPETVAEEGE